MTSFTSAWNRSQLLDSLIPEHVRNLWLFLVNIIICSALVKMVYWNAVYWNGILKGNSQYLIYINACALIGLCVFASACTWSLCAWVYNWFGTTYKISFNKTCVCSAMLYKKWREKYAMIIDQILGIRNYS